MSAPQTYIVTVDGRKMLRQGDRIVGKTKLLEMIEGVGDQIANHAKVRAELMDDATLDDLSASGQAITKNMIAAMERRSASASRIKAALEEFVPKIDDDEEESAQEDAEPDKTD